MGRNLGPLNIKDSYEGLVQISGSNQLTDGSGSAITSLDVTASYASQAGTSGFATSASFADVATSASFANTATSASFANQSGTSGFANTATSASYAVTASFALNAGTPTLQEVTTQGNVTTDEVVINNTLKLGAGSTGKKINIEASGSNANTFENLNFWGITIGNGNTSSKNSIIVGENNILDSEENGGYNFAFGLNNNLNPSNFNQYNLLLGANNRAQGGGDGVVLVGYNNDVTGGNYNGVFAGTANTAAHNRSVVIGGTGLSTSKEDEVVVPSLTISGSGVLTFADGTTQSTAAAGGGGGVTSIIAGTGISVDQATGDVTVSATGGGGTFPYTGSAEITGSLKVIGSNTEAVTVLGPLRMYDARTNPSYPYGINIEISGSTANTGGSGLNTPGMLIGGGNTMNGNPMYVIGKNNSATFMANSQQPNFIFGDNNTIAGNQTTYNTLIGRGNSISGDGDYGFIIGGNSNLLSSNAFDYGGIVGGFNNEVKHVRSVVIGGENLSTTKNDEVVVPSLTISGSVNQVGSTNNSVGGFLFSSGSTINPTVPNLTILGGNDNSITSNTNGGWGASILASKSSTASGYDSQIIGSKASTASNAECRILGGNNAIASGIRSHIFGGRNAVSSGTDAHTFGGLDATASGGRSIVIGGNGNTSSHTDSVVIGGASLSSTKANEVVVPHLRASGSVEISGSTNILGVLSLPGIPNVSASIAAGGGGGTNTTYDLDSIQVGSDVAITLIGSDATTDTVTLVAGTNVTLTDDGSSNITIDAAGGGGGGTLQDVITAGNIATGSAYFVGSLLVGNSGSAIPDTNTHNVHLAVNSGIANTGTYSAAIAANNATLGSGNANAVIGVENSHIYGGGNSNVILGSRDSQITAAASANANGILNAEFSSISAAGPGNVVIAGYANNITSGGYHFIIAKEGNTISGGSYNAIVGSFGSQISNGSDQTIIGGKNHTITSSGQRNTVIGGENHSIGSNYDNSVTIGGNGLIVRKSNEVVVPDLSVLGETYISSSVLGTGSLIDNLGQEALPGSDVVKHIVHCTQAEYDALIPDNNTLYVIDGSDVSNAFPYTGSADISGSLNVVGPTTLDNVTIDGTLSVVGDTTLQKTVVSGSLVGEVNILTDVGGTTALDCSLGNYFILGMPVGGTTTLTPTNIQAGQTINIKITQNATASTLTYAASIDFPGGTPFTISTGSGDVDVLTLVSFDGTTLQATGLANFS